jgi:hypothetical protein
MSEIVYIDDASEHLKELLDNLPFGETLTIVSPDGNPLAILVSINAIAGIDEPQEPAASIVEDVEGVEEVEEAQESVEDSPQQEKWESLWSSFAEETERAWKNDRSALEILSEMKR